MEATRKIRIAKIAAYKRNPYRVEKSDLTYRKVNVNFYPAFDFIPSSAFYLYFNIQGRKRLII